MFLKTWSVIIIMLWLMMSIILSGGVMSRVKTSTVELLVGSVATMRVIRSMMRVVRTITIIIMPITAIVHHIIIVLFKSRRRGLLWRLLVMWWW